MTCPDLETTQTIPGDTWSISKAHPSCWPENWTKTVPDILLSCLGEVQSSQPPKTVTYDYIFRNIYDILWYDITWSVEKHQPFWHRLRLSQDPVRSVSQASMFPRTGEMLALQKGRPRRCREWPGIWSGKGWFPKVITIGSGWPVISNETNCGKY